MQRRDFSAAWGGLGNGVRVENTGLQRVSGFAGLVGHDRSWGAWWIHGMPNGVFMGNWPKKCFGFRKNRKTLLGPLGESISGQRKYDLLNEILYLQLGKPFNL